MSMDVNNWFSVNQNRKLNHISCTFKLWEKKGTYSSSIPRCLIERLLYCLLCSFGPLLFCPVKIKVSVIFTLILSGQAFRQDYSEDIIIDGEQYFDGTEKILPANDWHKTGYDPKMLSHGNYYKVEPGSTVKMSCQFTNLSGLWELKIWKVDRHRSRINME